MGGKYRDAALAYKALNGLICVYKPPCVSVRQVQHTIITNLCRDLNALPDRPLERRVEISGATDGPLRVRLRPSLADHPRVCGPRYQHEDFRCRHVAHLGLFTSGVLLLGINDGTRMAYHLNETKPTRAYKVYGQLGKATDTYFWNGKTVERASYQHVTREKIDRVVAHMQAAHQKTMFEMSGLHMDSQTTYELASQGLIRPASSKLPILYGIKCVHFEPPNFTLDLNALPDRPLERRVEISGATDGPLRVRLRPSLADHPRVCGPRYQHEDFRCRHVAHLGLFTSGVLLLGINDGTRMAYHLNETKPTRAYKVYGQLGKATDTYFWNGKTVERASYQHVTREKIDRVVAHMQAAHQKTMFEMSGLHMDSQTTYELASQGLIRPANSKLPVLYGIKCVHFEPPNFTLEVQAVNEYDTYLWTLAHELGVQLRSCAHCAALVCVRHAGAGVERALLRKHWRLDHVVESVRDCRDLVRPTRPEATYSARAA